MKFRNILIVITAAFILMAVAFINGYALVTSDSGAYIRFAFDFQVLKDRSSFYSVFLAFSGLRFLHSVWLPVFVQCLLVVSLLLRLYKILSVRAYIRWYEQLFVIAAISLLTSASWFAAYIMPDIFTGILLLSVLLFLFDGTNRFRVVLYSLLVVLSIMVHNSHFLILPLCIVALILLVWVFKIKKIATVKLLQVLMLSAFCWVAMCSLNVIKGMGFRLSPGSHVYLAGRLVESGVMKEYLNDSCGATPSGLCPYQAELRGHAYDYIWSDNGAFAGIGGWEHSDTLHNKIISDVFTTPKYIGMFCLSSLKDTWRQLLFVLLPDREPSFGVDTQPYIQIRNNVKEDVSQFTNSRQQRGLIDNAIWNKILLWTLLLTTTIVILLALKRDLSPTVGNIYLVAILFVICNAFVTATFANVLERLQSRVFWVLPACNIMLIINHYIQRIKNSNKENVV